MENIVRNKWQVRVAAILIFVLGFAAGALAVNVYRGWRHRAGLNPEDRFEQMASRLQLNADQKAQVRQIFGDAREQLQALRKQSEPRVKEIREQTDQRLQQVLTPEQWQRFEQMRNEFRGRRDHDERGNPINKL
jgi:Spy/CpxP family protein refolding chaperone